MTGVSVWDREPDERDLQDLREAQGWQPQSTAMRTGEEILGDAARWFGASNAPDR